MAEHNGRLMTGAGVRWARDVGAPRVADPVDGRLRALSLGVRDRWRGRAGFPYVRAAGTWLDRAGTMPGERSVEAETADELLRLAIRQLDDGADLLKLYLDGPEPGVAPWTRDELAPVVAMAHARGVKATAHSGNLAGAREGVAAGVDSREHGTELDAAVTAEMAARGTALVSTLAIFRSWRSLATTTSIPRFASPEGRARILDRRARAQESVRLAHAAGVAIATGTDFGGGSTRANQLVWEVECLVEAGLEPWEALGAATWRGGQLLGEPDAGSSARAVRPTSASCTAIHSRTLPRSGVSGASPGPADRASSPALSPARRPGWTAGATRLQPACARTTRRCSAT